MTNLVFNWNLQDLSTNQKKIADFIEKNPQRIAYLTEQDIATELNISIASVSRFWKAVGYTNFKVFKSILQQNMQISPSNKLKNLINKISNEDILGNMLEQGIHYLEQTALHSSREDLQAAVDAIATAETVYVYAPGPSAGLGILLDFRLNRIGISVRLLNKSGHELFELLLNIKPTDLVVIIGFIRMLPEAEAIVKHAKDVGFQTILITDLLVSDMHSKVNMVLFADRGPLWEFHSMVAPTLIVESLIVGVGMKQQAQSLDKLEQLNSLRKRFCHILPR